MRLKLPFPLLARLALCLFLGAMALPSSAQTVVQTIVLQPGANPIFFEVAPADPKVGDIFSDPAIVSVWQPRVKNSTISFIQNPNAIPFNTAGWMVYVPTNQPESINNDLYTVTPNTPYVVNVSGTAPVVVTVTGRPSVQPLPFSPNAYTLRGFPVDPVNSPTFQTFFKPSIAHYNNGAGPLTPIYKYNQSTAQWQQVMPGESMVRGTAYWVYSLGSSSYMAPLTATCPIGDGLDFGTTVFELDLKLQNTTANLMNVTVSDLGGAPHALVFAVVTNTTTQGIAWTPLVHNFVVAVPAGATKLLQLGIARSAIPGNSYATVLGLNDGNGTLLQVPVTAQAPTSPQAGLWVGDITVNGVAQVYNTNSTNYQPANPPFVMRAMLHVTPTGAPRFLHEAIEMLQTAVTETNAGVVTTVVPAQTVLLTDKSLLSQYTGVVLRDGTPVGRRISTAAFDFDPPGGTNFLPMVGLFGVNNSAQVSITLSPTTPTNPFLHRYNPEHDNLDPLYAPLSTNVPPEVYTITRQIQFTFTPTDPNGQTPTDYGVNEIGGTYQETLLGLNRNPLRVTGTFHLVHTLTEPYLNVIQ